MSWTPERVARAAKFWTEDGLSAAEIAQRLGGVTRNAVIGKLCRIGLAGQGSRKSGQRAYRQQPSAPRAVAVVQHRTRPRNIHAAVVKVAPPPAIERAEDGMTWPLTPRSATLLTLQACQCRWPVGHATGADQLFCGEARGEGPYCPGHARIAGSDMSADEWARKNARWVQRMAAS